MEKTAIFKAIEARDPVALASAVASDPTSVNSEGIRGYNLLAQAAEVDDEQMTRYLLSHGAETFQSGVLHMALSRRNLTVAAALLEFGADINEVKEGSKMFCDGDTPLISAIKGGHLDAVQFALDHGTSIFKTSYEPWEGFDFHKGIEKIPPLHAAIHCKSLEIVKLLLSCGADIYQEASGWKLNDDKEGRTGNAIHFAAGYGTREICEEILGRVDYEVIQSENTDDYNSPMVWAAQEQNLDGLIYLLRRGVDLLYSNFHHPYDDFVLYLVRRQREVKGTLPEHEQQQLNELLQE